MDVKKIGEIADGGVWRADGRAATGATMHNQAKLGYDYVHSLVNDHSRLASLRDPDRSAPPGPVSWSERPTT